MSCQFYQEIVEHYKHNGTCHFHNVCACIDSKFLLFICEMNEKIVYLIYTLATNNYQSKHIQSFIPEVVTTINAIGSYTWSYKMASITLYDYTTEDVLYKENIYTSNCNQLKRSNQSITFSEYCQLLPNYIEKIKQSAVISSES